MAKVHELVKPQGAWVHIREADEVPEKLRRAHQSAMAAMLDGAGVEFDAAGRPTKAKMTAGSVDNVSSVKDALIIAYVQGWSFDTPITAETLGEMASGTYDEIHKLAKEAYDKGQAVLVADPSQAKDPASPTVPLAE